MAKRTAQLKLLKDSPKAYGGDLLNKRKGRSHGRPLDTKNTMHLVLRSSKAKGKQSFYRLENARKVWGIVDRFSKKYGIRVLSFANVGNHLHLQIKLANRFTYRPFIRAVTAAIAMAITGRNRWNKEGPKEKFWDLRPFTRVVVGWRAFLNLQDYIAINRAEGFGFSRDEARDIIRDGRSIFSSA
jgi:hypothetical protein